MKNLLRLILFAFILVSTSCNDEDTDFANSTNGIENNAIVGTTTDDKYDALLTYAIPDSTYMNDSAYSFTEPEVNSHINTKAKNLSYYDDENHLMQFADYPLFIRVRESSTDKRWLYNNGLNKEITLNTWQSKNTMRHAFYLNRQPLSGGGGLYLETKVGTGMFGLIPKKKLVSAGSYTNNPDKTVLYVKDGTSAIGALWRFAPSPRDVDGGAYILYNTTLYGGGSNYWDVYNLCLQGSGSNLSFDKYTRKGIQEFEIIPSGEFEMLSLQLINDHTSFAVKKPDFYVTWDYNNNSGNEQSMSTNFGKKAAYTSSFSHRHSITLTITSSLSVKGGVFAEGKIQTSVSTANEWTYGKTETAEDTRNYNFPLIIPKKTRIHATLYVAQYEMNLKYKAVFREKNTGKIFSETGEWQGVDCTDIKVDVQATDSYGNTKKLQLAGIPTKSVKL